MSRGSEERARERRRVRRRRLTMQRQHEALKRRDVRRREEFAWTWSPASEAYYCDRDPLRCVALCALARLDPGRTRRKPLYEPESVNRGRLRPMCGVQADRLREEGTAT